MNLLKLFSAAVIASLISAPVAAKPANPAAKLSLASSATSAQSTEQAPANERTAPKSANSASLPLIAAGVAVVVGLALALGGNDSKPASN